MRLPWLQHLRDGKISSFVNSLGRKPVTNRKSKKRDPLDLEISQMFRSHYAQPKGRKKGRFLTRNKLKELFTPWLLITL